MKCLICEKKESVKLFSNYKLEIKEDEEFFKNLKIYTCEDCHFKFCYPMPEAAKLDYFYKKIYRSNGRPPYLLEENYEDQKKHYLDDKNLSYLLYISTLIDLKKVVNLYDFGSGYGDFGFGLKNKFPNINLYCSESDEFCQKILKERKYKNFLDLNNIDIKFDLIVSFHSLEHLTSINDILKKFNSYLNYEGHLFFEVPNCTEEYWNGRPYDSPHLLFFSKKSLELLAKKNGFEFVNLSFSSYSFTKDHKYQKESRYLWEKGNSSFFTMLNLKKLIKKYIPKKVISIRQDYLQLKKIRNKDRLDWFVNNTGDNCYIRGLLKKKKSN